jgi:hypothetical protein
VPNLAKTDGGGIVSSYGGSSRRAARTPDGIVATQTAWIAVGGHVRTDLEAQPKGIADPISLFRVTRDER